MNIENWHTRGGNASVMIVNTTRQHHSEGAVIFSIGGRQRNDSTEFFLSYQQSIVLLSISTHPQQTPLSLRLHLVRLFSAHSPPQKANPLSSAFSSLRANASAPRAPTPCALPLCSILPLGRLFFYIYRPTMAAPPFPPLRKSLGHST